MPNTFKVTNKLVLSYLGQESFRLSELEEEIYSIGAPMRIAPAYTVREYLNDLQEDGFISFNYIQGTIHRAQNHRARTSQLSNIPEIK